MDYGKFKYESALKARESRKNQAQTVIKEIKLRPKIDPHDYGTKKGHVERFLRQGDKVKVTIMFRGREQSRPELGFRLLQRLAGDVEELGFVESQPKQDGRNMIMVIGPHRRKSETKAERAVPREGGVAGRTADAGAPAPGAVRRGGARGRRVGCCRGRAGRAREHTGGRSRRLSRRGNASGWPTGHAWLVVADEGRRTSHRWHAEEPGPSGVWRSPRHQARGGRRAPGAQETETATMPKMKTHSGAAKRFRLTGTGKVMRRRANRNHLLEHKSTRRTRRLTGDVTLAPADVRKIKKLLAK